MKVSPSLVVRMVMSVDGFADVVAAGLHAFGTLWDF